MALAQVQGIVAAALPAKVPDGQQAPANIRLGAYQDLIVPFGPEAQASEEGALFVVTNPTPGTAIQIAAAGENAAAPTQPTKTGLLAIINQNSPGGASIRPKALKLILAGTAPTGTVSLEFVHRLQAASRGAQSNNVTLTPVCPNGNRSQKTGAVFTFATTHAITFGNSPDAAGVIAGRSHIATSLGIVGDEYVLKYGDDDSAGSVPGITATRSTGVGRFVSDAPAVVIPPGWTYVLDYWWLTQAANAMSVEFEFKYYEK